ncbi:hypothetical protein [Labilibaculum euxinus]
MIYAGKPVLHLNLKRKWFQMISEEIKKEEYRAITPYWSRVFVNGKIKIKGKLYHPTDVFIQFSNGYSKNRHQNMFECKGLRVGLGKYEWGAEPNIQYYVLELGEPTPF